MPNMVLSPTILHNEQRIRSFDTNHLYESPRVGKIDFDANDTKLTLHKRSSLPDIHESSSVQFPIDREQPVYIAEEDFIRLGGTLPMRYFQLLGALNTPVLQSNVRSYTSNRNLNFTFGLKDIKVNSFLGPICPLRISDSMKADSLRLYEPFPLTPLELGRLKSVFMVVSCNWIVEGLAGHANAIVLIHQVGSKLVTVERFEPHGEEFQFGPKLKVNHLGHSQVSFDFLLHSAFALDSGIFSSRKVKTQAANGLPVEVDMSDVLYLRKQFSRYLGLEHEFLTYKYIGLQTDSCPLALAGPQSRQRHFKGELGLCAIWSAIYMDMRIRNPERTSHEIISALLQMDPTQLLQFSQKFSLYMTRVIKKNEPSFCRYAELIGMINELHYSIHRYDPWQYSPGLEYDLRTRKPIPIAEMDLILQLVKLGSTESTWGSSILKCKNLQELLVLAQTVPEDMRPPICADGSELVKPMVWIIGGGAPKVKGICKPQCGISEFRNPLTLDCVDSGVVARKMMSGGGVL